MDSALQEAIRKDNLEGLKTALRNGANPNQGDKMYTPLTMIAEDPRPENRPEMLRLLLKAGADANLKDDFTIPLEYAVDGLRQVVMYKESYTEEQYKTYVKECNDIIEILCPATDPANIEKVNKKYPGLLPESCLFKVASERVEPAMKALEAHTNKSYRAPPGTYDVPPGFSESVGEYAYGVKTPRPAAGKRKNKRKTNKRRNTLKRRRTLKK